MLTMADSLTVTELADDWRRSLRAANKSPNTIRSYLASVAAYSTWAEEHGAPVGVGDIERRHIEDWITSVLDSDAKPSTAATFYRTFQQFWRWTVEEGERDISPMAGMSPPQQGEKVIPVFTDDEITRLLAACETGPAFDARRDAAIIRMFLATGARLSEMAGMDLDHLDLDAQAVIVTGKGDRQRLVPYSDKASVALDRYRRERRRHSRHADPALWIGPKGRLTGSGITQLLRRRAKTAGIEDVHPHRFRHTGAHRAQLAGLSESDLMDIYGWRSPEMVRRYGASARSERARQAWRQLDID